MRIVISGQPSWRRERAVKHLGHIHDVAVTVPGEDPSSLVAQSNAIVHFLSDVGQATGRDDPKALVATVVETYALLLAVPENCRFILVSSLGVFEDCPVEWRINEDWRPRPTTRIDDLVVHLNEAVLREIARARPIRGIVLRCGEIVAEENPPRSRGVHIQDVLRAIDLALAYSVPDGYMWGWHQAQHGWRVFHIIGGGRNQRFGAGKETREVLGYTPEYDVSGDEAPAVLTRPPPLRVNRPQGPIRRVAVFGAWGPLGAAVVSRLDGAFDLRLCDLVSREDAMLRRSAVRGDPRPIVPSGSYEQRIVDVTDADQVMAAAKGMDALINVTVNRSQSNLAFGVNMLGAYHIAKAALANNIRRIVHTGPEQVSDGQQGGHWPDFNIPADASPRPGSRLYFLSKFLGQEISRLFAEQHGLEIPALLFGHLRNPRDLDLDTIDGMPIAVSWEDAAEAIRCALVAPTLPAPFQVFNVVADLPQDKLSNRAAKEILAWQPKDQLEMLWTRPFPNEGDR